MNRKTKRVVLVTLGMLLLVAHFWGAIYVYVYSMFSERNFELGSYSYQVEYPNRVTRYDGREVVILHIPRTVRNGIYLEGTSDYIAIRQADMVIDHDEFRKVCQESGSIGEGLEVGFDGGMCYLRSPHTEKYYEFRYLMFPNLAFFSDAAEIDIWKSGLRALSQSSFPRRRESRESPE